MQIQVGKQRWRAKINNYKEKRNILAGDQKILNINDAEEERRLLN